jgi:FixJ family two-component response regulator
LSDWVAVIDDDDTVRHSLARLFKALGIHARVYESADEYVDQPLRNLPACIVIDVQLQAGRSAFDLIDWMDVGGQRVPVIFMTGQLELQTEMYGRYPELRETLRKPFDPDRLISRVRHHMEASAAVSRSIITPF